MITLTIRSSKGQTRVSVPSTATLGDLKAAVEAALGVAAARQTLLVPPASPVVGGDGDATTLATLGIKGGALVLKETHSGDEAPPTAAPAQPPHSTASSSSSSGSGAVGGRMVRRVVDADNSCLFTSFSYVLEGKTRSKPQQIRQVVADVLLRNQELYTEAFLNKSNADYRKWIVLPGAWGGAIEIAILSEHYRCEVGVFDVQTKRLDLYGEGSKVTKAFTPHDDGSLTCPPVRAPRVPHLRRPALRSHGHGHQRNSTRGR